MKVTATCKFVSHSNLTSNLILALPVFFVYVVNVFPLKPCCL